MVVAAIDAFVKASSTGQQYKDNITDQQGINVFRRNLHNDNLAGTP